MAVRQVLDRLSPDLVQTFRRFPFAILLAALGTITALVALNPSTRGNEDFWIRLLFGFGSATVVAIAGTLFSESRPNRRSLGLILTWLLPLLPLFALQIRDTYWISALPIPLVCIFWLSVSSVTAIARGKDRELQQDRFWWLNHQAAATALIAIIAFALIALGIFAIERSLSILFGLDAPEIFYRWVLPVIGLFCTPVYWLSTIPRLHQFDERALREPDMVARAMGFLGQFVLTPLLLAYALILLAYTVQILILQQLPEGMLGWMVLGFSITGAANWLVLHPAFMRERGLVRLFRRSWFWLTVIPLLLYALAVFVRIDAYGLTPERVLLIVGGLWAALLTLVFLTRHGDIRLIPALAGLLLLIAAVGPWNIENLALWDQASRLDALLSEGNVVSLESKPRWRPEEAALVSGAMNYLAYNGNDHRELRAVLARHGIDYDPAKDTDTFDILAKLGALPDTTYPGFDTISVERDRATPVNVEQTPLFVGRHTMARTANTQIAGMNFALSGMIVTAAAANGVKTDVDLTDWLAGNEGTSMANPVIDFTLGGIHYRYVVDRVSADALPDGSRQLDYLDGTLFASATPTL